jgi:hypothetical protein
MASGSNDGRRVVTHDLNGRPLRWRDDRGVIHAVEFSPPSTQGGVGAWWTRCGAANISRTEAWGSPNEITCAACRKIEAGV